MTIDQSDPRLLPRRALVVEDEPATRRLLIELLEADGCVVDSAGDGEVAALLLAREDYEVVLLDLGLPRVGGTDIMEHIVCTRPHTLARTIVVTGSDVSGVRRLFPEVCDALSKPVSAARLHEAVARARSNA